MEGRKGEGGVKLTTTHRIREKVLQNHVCKGVKEFKKN